MQKSLDFGTESSRFLDLVFGLAPLVPFISGFREGGFSSIPFMIIALNLSSAL